MYKITKNNLYRLIIGMCVLAFCSSLEIFEACSVFEDTGPYYYKIKIDTITFPQYPVNHGDTLKAAFWGTIGSDTCAHFSHFDIANDSSHAEITVWGVEMYAYRKICPSAVVLLKGEVCRLHPVKEGTYTIVVNQPDGSKKQVQIPIN